MTRTAYSTNDSTHAVNGFDYENQAWVINGLYIRCGHPESMNCGCYGREHQGEAVSIEAAANVR